MAVDEEQLALAPAGPRRGPGYRVFHYAMMLVGAAAIAVIGTAVGIGVHERLKPDPRVASVRLISDGSSIAGASSTFTRGADVATEQLTTLDLPKGHIVTLRAEIFNHPERCTHPTAQGHCGPDDLSAAGVDGSVVFLTSSWLRVTTDAKFAVSLFRDDVKHAIVGSGLTNPTGAEIRFVLMDHGVPTSGDSKLLSTLGEGCTSPPYGDGAPGTTACTDLQYVTYRP